MSKNQIPIDYFVCPITKANLKFDGESLISPSGDIYSRNKKYAFWEFIPKRILGLNYNNWRTWHQLQLNSEVAYKNDPIHNLSIGEKRNILQFADFCSFEGLIIDIGCGPQKFPSYLKYTKNKNAFFIGIDPLVGEQPKEYAFVHALGEYLPFRNNLFDQALFVTSLDHFNDPFLGLMEAKRVIKPKAHIFIWIGTKDKNAPNSPDSPKWYKELKIPEGSEDEFHKKRFTDEYLCKLIKEVKLQLKCKENIITDKWKKSIFYKLSK